MLFRSDYLAELGIPAVVVITKIDKLSWEKRQKAVPKLIDSLGLDPDQVRVPSFLPDTAEIRHDILDYCYEIQWFDQHLGRLPWW